MITNFKIFESINVGEPKVGDYVIIKYFNEFGLPDKNFEECLKNNIGQIREVDKVDNDYVIEYSELHKKLLKIFNNNLVPFNKKHIEYWSESKEELEALIRSKKYNL